MGMGMRRRGFRIVWQGWRHEFKSFFSSVHKENRHVKVIFHTPVPLDPSAAVACGIRPLMMLKAFQEIGAEVTVIAGYGADRKKSIKQVKRKLANGELYDFCYSESPPFPTLLTEKSRFPFYPFLDFGFFEVLKKAKVPIDLFYRDIYWMFDEIPTKWGFIKKNIVKFFYQFDLDKYQKLVDILYLPTEKMGTYLPEFASERKLALPPGLNLREKITPKASRSSLNLFYVGGIGHSYQMHEVFKAIEGTAVDFTLCTREAEWRAVKDEYACYMSDRVKIVHKSGFDLNELYDKADIAMLFFKPDEYREFAAPLKLYEYIGHGKPIIASAKTHAGEFVEKNGVGWVLDYQSESLVSLLKYPRENPAEICSAAERSRNVAAQNTWADRARLVSAQLSKSHSSGR
jgi:glycosyltransferase involved in cell wall biosynthesis